MTTTATIDHFKNDTAENIKKLHSSLFEDEITDKTNIKEIVPVVTISEAIFSIEGDISIIGGLPKAGKTSVSSFLLGTALMKDLPDGMDTISIRTTYCNGREVVYIDTEQPKAFTNKLRKSVKKLIGKDDQPDNLKIINLRKYPSEEKQKKVFEWMRVFPNAHLWIIDGVADLIKDPNDTKEAFDIIQKFMTKADELNTTIILYIHENPGTSGKLRGNLGSEAERKCGGAITIKKHKDKGVHSIEAKLIRGSADFEPVFFRYDKPLGRMVSLDAAETSEIRKTTDKGKMKETRLKEMAKHCLITGSMRFGEFSSKIRANAPQIDGKAISDRTAATRIKDMLDYGFITQNGDLYVYADI